MTASAIERCTACGRTLPQEGGICADYDGERRPFCSRQCQARFECEPARYVGEPTCLDCPPGYS